MNTRVCCSCKIEKNISFFGVNNATVDGIMACCKDCNRARCRRHYKNNRKKIIANTAKWGKMNPDKVKEYSKRDAEKHGERRRACDASWRRNNKDRLRAKASKRRAVTKTSTPSWANDEIIMLFYETARVREDRTGKKVHVDHIIPLKSDNVCGLHVEHNLQLMWANENISKGNRHWPDMWNP